MALSDEEQRLLDQMEAALAAEDPRLASALRGTTSRRLHRRRAALAGIGFLVGIACLIGGMEFHLALSILGFLIMLASSVVAILSWSRIGGDDEGASPGHPDDHTFLNTLEERWRRQDES